LTTEAKVGAFVLASLLILTSTVVYLANAQFRGGKVPYRTYLHYAGGLEAGAPVLFGGINAGSVTTVRPWPSDPTRIEILVELKEGTPVNQKSVAKLGSVSVMSEPALLVSTGTNDADRIAPGQAIPSQEAVTLDEIAAKMATVAGNANDLILQVKGELGGISGDARTLLANLNSVTTDERPKIDRLTDQLLALSQHADAVIAKVGPVVEHADSAIQNVNGVVEDMREPIRMDLAEVQTTLQQAKNVLADMQSMVRANDFKIDDTVENLRLATDNLDQLTDQLRQRPWSLIRIKQPKERKVPE
jgi:phospholipid/cholesterol/gamma-HCH transport system substrate-binding protein